MNNYLSLILIINISILSHTNTFSQVETLPKDGNTYAKAYLPNQFRIEAIKTKCTTSYVNFTQQEAKYDTVTMGLLANAHKKELLVNIYDFEVAGKSMTIEREDMVLIDSDEEFSIRNDIQEKIVNRWSLSNLALCDSPQNDCDLFEWVEIPFKYAPKKDQIGKSSENDNQLKSSTTFFNIKITGRREVLPIEYVFYTKVVEVQSAKKLVVEIPATYKTTFQKVALSSFLKKKWIEVISPEVIDDILISQIQLALKVRKKYTEDINGTWNATTQAALEYFQIENELCVGRLDKKTLEQLGFNFEMLKSKNITMN